MGTELWVTLPGPEGPADARRAVWILGKVIDLLDELDRVQGARGGERTTWAMTRLGLGSVCTGFAAARPRHGLTVADAERKLREAAEGFAAAEAQPLVPDQWTRGAVKIGTEIGRALGATAETGMLLELMVDGQRTQEVQVTRRSGDHLSVALRERQHSIGSLIGQLQGVNLEGRKAARLWVSWPRKSVEVLFNDGQFEEIRAGLSKRVEISGLLERDGTGAPVRIRMRSLDVLPGVDEAPPLASFAGLDPDFTGGMDPAEYVRMLRDTA